MRLLCSLLLLGLWGCLVTEPGTKPITSATSIAATPVATPIPLASPILIAGNGTHGYIDAPKEQAQFHGPQGITKEPQGNLYVADMENHRIRKIDKNGLVTTVAGNSRIPNSSEYNNWRAEPDAEGRDGPALQASFHGPTNLLLLKNGDLWFSAYDNNLRKLTPDGQVKTLLKSGYYGGFMILDPKSDNIYASSYTHQISRIAPDLKITILAGNIDYFRPNMRDGPAMDVGISAHGLAFDSKGNLYFTDRNNLIRKLSSDFTTVTTVAGDIEACRKALCETSLTQPTPPGGIPSINADCRSRSCPSGYKDGSALTAQFDMPAGIVIDKFDNIYIADVGNNAIRKLTPGRMVSTIAHIEQPYDIILDKNGDFYVSSMKNSAIYKFSLP